MDEIFGKNKDVVAAHTVSSQVTGKQVSKSVLSGQKDNCASKSPSPAEIICVPPSLSSSSSSSINTNKNAEATVRRRHGTGSNLTNRKLNIEQQWLKFLENKEERDTARDNRHAESEKRANESLTLKKQIIALKKKQIEQKRELLNKKLKDKENRHAEIIKIEEKKCNLLKKVLHQTNVNILDDSDEN